MAFGVQAMAMKIPSFSDNPLTTATRKAVSILKPSAENMHATINPKSLGVICDTCDTKDTLTL